MTKPDGGQVSGVADITTLFATPGVHSADRRHLPIHRPQVESALLLVRHAGLVERIDRWLAEDGYSPRKGGRPSAFTAEQVLALIVLLALEGQDLHVTLMRDAVLYRLTDNAADCLGIKRDTRKWRRHRKAVYQRLWRAVRRVLKPLDPHPDEQRRRRYTKVEWAEVLAHRDTDLERRRYERLREFNNALIWTTVQALPRDVFSRWDGTVCVDGTHIPAVKKGTGKKGKKVSSEPNAGWYRRDHEEVDSNGVVTTHNKYVWAWDAALAVMAHPGPDGAFPRLVLGMSMDKPSVAPIPNAMTALRNVLDADVPRGFMVGDRAYYPHAKPEGWQVPIRKAGYRIVGDVLIQSDAKGKKYGAGVQDAHAGATLVDGTWTCPAMPKPLAQATMDLHNGTITEEEWQGRLERRTAYHLRPKEAPRDNGSQCFKCPASGPGATVNCPLKALAPKAKGQPKRTKILDEDLPAHPGPVCTNANSVTIPVEVAAKYAQALVWESKEWHLAYHYPRNTVESRNGAIKRTTGGSVAAHDRRLLRGVAGQFFLVGLMVAAENVRTAELFFRRARNAPDHMPEPTPPGPPDPRTRRQRLIDNSDDLANAPPLAA